VTRDLEGCIQLGIANSPYTLMARSTPHHFCPHSSQAFEMI
jgi:hypothetical protein